MEEEERGREEFENQEETEKSRGRRRSSEEVTSY